MESNKEQTSFITPEKIISSALNRLERGWSYPDFPSEFKPQGSLREMVYLVSNEEMLHTLEKRAESVHPYLREEVRRVIVETVSAIAYACADRTQNRILVNESLLWEKTAGGIFLPEIVLVLGHEFGHLLSKVREPQPVVFLGGEIQKEAELALGQLSLKERDISEVYVQHQGLCRSFLIDGLEIDCNSPCYDELYANTYSSYLFCHFLRGFQKDPEAALLNYLEASGRDFESTGVRYAEFVGWEDIISAGIHSDLDTFVKAGDGVLGQKLNRTMLEVLKGLFVLRIEKSSSSY